MGYPDVVRAAHNALKAGDKEAARKLWEGAIQMERARVEAGGVPRVDSPALFNQGEQPEDTFGNTIQKFTEEPIAATKYFAGKMVEPGLTPMQRIDMAGMTAMNAFGTGASFGAALVGELLGNDPTQERKAAGDVLAAMTVAVPELAGVSSTTRIAGRTGRAVMEEIPEPRNRVEAGKRAADELGITPSLGSGGVVRAQTAATLEKVPLVGNIIADDSARFVDAIADVHTNATAKIGQAERAPEAGTTLQGGLQRYVDRSQTRANELFDKVSKAIPEGTLLRLENARAAIDELKAPFANNPEAAAKLKLNEWDALLAEAADKGLPWQAVRQIRTDIGAALKGDRGALEGEAIGRLKKLYGALSQDMAETAELAGPKAVAAWKEANDFYRRFAKRVERSLDKTISAESPERAFEAFERMAREGASSSDVLRMRQIKASLKPSEWREVSASIVDRMGRATAGQQNAEGTAFSASKFLTDWSKMSEEAKKLLLPEDVRVELNNLAKVAETAKAAGAERNFSNTGTIFTGALFGTGMYNAPVTTAAITGGAWASAKAMTSPVFLRALNRAGRGDLRQLNALAKGDGPFAEDAKTVLRITAAEAGASANENQVPRVRTAQ